MPDLFRPVPIPESAYNDGSYVNYHLGDYSVNAVEIYYNGQWLPLPTTKPGSGLITTTAVSDGRNNAAQFIGRQIGRTQSKINNLVFPALYAHEWATILQVFKDQIERPVRYFDQEAGAKITRQMYVNDRTAEIYSYRENGDVEIFVNCSLNLIDTGR